MDFSSLFSAPVNQAPPPEAASPYGYGSYAIWIVILILVIFFIGRLYNPMPAPYGYQYGAPPIYSSCSGYPGYGPVQTWVWIILLILILAFIFFWRR